MSNSIPIQSGNSSHAISKIDEKILALLDSATFSTDELDKLVSIKERLMSVSVEVSPATLIAKATCDSKEITSAQQAPVKLAVAEKSAYNKLSGDEKQAINTLAQGLGISPKAYHAMMLNGEIPEPVKTTATKAVERTASTPAKAAKPVNAEKSAYNKLTGDEKQAINTKAQLLGIKPKEYFELMSAGNLPEKVEIVKDVVTPIVTHQKSAWNLLSGDIKTYFHDLAAQRKSELKGKDYFNSLSEEERKSAIESFGVDNTPQVEVKVLPPSKEEVKVEVAQVEETISNIVEVTTEVETEDKEVVVEDDGTVTVVAETIETQETKLDANGKTKRANKAIRQRENKQAKKQGISLEELRAKKLLDGVNQQHKYSRKESKNTLDELTKLMNKVNLANIFTPEYINITRWDSDEYKAMYDENPKAWDLANASVQGLVNGESGEKRLDTFNFENGTAMSKEEILNKVMSVITDPNMMDVEEKFRAKVGKYQALPYYQWADKINALWKPVNWTPNMEILAKSKLWLTNLLFNLIVENFDSDVINPLSVNDALDKVTKGRNSGFPFFTSKWFENEDMVSYYKNQAEDMINGAKLNDPRILYKRVANNGETSKMRAVICPPKSEAIAAKCFTDSYVKIFKTHKQFCGFNGGENIHQTAYKLLDGYKTFISSDFSAFDASCQKIMIEVFDILKSLAPVEYQEYFENTLAYYQHSHLITPLGILSSDNINGLNSGDGWTSILGTLCNALANKYTMLSMDLEGEVLSFGDDCVIATNELFNTKAYSHYMNDLGMECNPEKQEISSGDNARFSFLGYYYFKQDLEVGEENSHMLPKFPIMRALSSLIYREKFAKLEELANNVGLTKEEMEELEKCNKRGIDMLGHLQKLENLRNHPDYVAFCNLFRNLEPNKMNTDLIVPFQKVMDGFVHLRIVRGRGIETLATLRLLYAFEDKDLQHSMLELKDTFNEHYNGSFKQQIDDLGGSEMQETIA